MGAMAYLWNSMDDADSIVKDYQEETKQSH